MLEANFFKNYIT